LTNHVYDPVKAKKAEAEIMKKMRAIDPGLKRLRKVQAEEKRYTEKLRRKNG